MNPRLANRRRWLSAIFFTIGFVGSFVLPANLESIPSLLRQAGFILLAGALLVDQIRRDRRAPSLFRGFWLQTRWIDRALPFLLGNLLSTYLAFYFKSASLSTSYLFLLMLLSVLLFQEVSPNRARSIELRYAMLQIPTLSFATLAVSLAMRKIGDLPFCVAAGASLVASLAFAAFFAKELGAYARGIRRVALGAHAAWIALYFASWIPPVPLSLSHFAIYHGLNRIEDGKGLRYELARYTPKWKFWKNGDQDFDAAPGDPLVAFAQLRVPLGFEEKLMVRWEEWIPNAGWITQDRIPFQINGVRRTGYRGYTRKQLYAAGLWRVKIETEDQREIGRLRVRIRYVPAHPNAAHIETF